MIGGCGAIPAKTNELVWAIGSLLKNWPQINADGHGLTLIRKRAGGSDLSVQICVYLRLTPLSCRPLHAPTIIAAHMDRFEVLIVGAGPAGSFAAEQLARAGVRVGLFDGRPPGEPKACGGGVTSKALKAWPHLLEAVGRTIDELDMYSPSGKHLHLQLDEPFAVYSRIAFDTFLRERAQKAGAKVLAEKISARGFARAAGRMPALPADDGWIVRTQSEAEFS